MQLGIVYVKRDGAGQVLPGSMFVAPIEARADWLQTECPANDDHYFGPLGPAANA